MDSAGEKVQPERVMKRNSGDTSTCPSLPEMTAVPGRIHRKRQCRLSPLPGNIYPHAGVTMKNILILSSSPRKGSNSDLLCEEFMKGAIEAGHMVEKITLREKNIHPCLGCEACQNTHSCVQKDDMADILDKMIKADVIVMGTPVYFYTMCSQMKALIDRTVPRYTEISGKEFYFIITAADSNAKALERTLDGFRGFTDCLEGVQEKSALLVPGVWKRGEVAGSEAVARAYLMGRNA